MDPADQTVQLTPVSCNNASSGTEATSYTLSNAEHETYSLLLSPTGEMATYLLPAEDSLHTATAVARDAVLKASSVETFPTLEPVTVTTSLHHSTATSAEHCLVCNSTSDQTTPGPYALFDGTLFTSVTRSPMVETLEGVVETQLEPRLVHSHLICAACYHLADRLDHLENELRQVRFAVHRLYWQTAALYQTPAADGSNAPSSTEHGPNPAGKPAAAARTGRRAPPQRRRASAVAAEPAARPREAAEQQEVASRLPAADPAEGQMTVVRQRPQLGAGLCRSTAGELRPTPPPVVAAEVEIKQQPHDPELLETDAGQLGVCNEIDIDIHVDKTGTKKKRPKSTGRPTCGVCGKTFQRPARLHEHLAAHTVAPVNRCDICSKTFTQKYYLREHIKQIHEGRGLHNCATCGKVFMRRLHLDDHMRTHNGDRPYVCELCGKGFSQRGNLRAHQLVHTDNYPYQCDTCGKRVRTRQAFETHQRKHNNDRRHKCDVCPASFLMKRSLDRHQRKHTGVRPFKCTVCDRAFRDRGDLRCHEDTHSGQRRHVCPLCGMGFSRRYKMQNHVKSKHGRTEEQMLELCMLQKTAHSMFRADSEGLQVDFVEAGQEDGLQEAADQARPSGTLGEERLAGPQGSEVAGPVQLHLQPDDADGTARDPLAIDPPEPKQLESSRVGSVVSERPLELRLDHDTSDQQTRRNNSQGASERPLKSRPGNSARVLSARAQQAPGERQLDPAMVIPDPSSYASHRPVQVILEPNTSLQSMQARVSQSLSERPLRLRMEHPSPGRTVELRCEPTTVPGQPAQAPPEFHARSSQAQIEQSATRVVDGFEERTQCHGVVMETAPREQVREIDRTLHAR